MKKFPHVSEELLKALETAFPDKAPRSTEITLTEVGGLMGEQRVLDLLRSHHRKQNILEG